MWSAVTLHGALQELQRSPAISAFRRKNLKHLAFVINGAPKIVRLAIAPRLSASAIGKMIDDERVVS